MDQDNSTSPFIQLLKPEEIIEFLDQQTIDEEKATGLRLLRRAAQTIEALMRDNDHYYNAIRERDQALEQADSKLAQANMQSMSGKFTAPSPDQLALQEAVKFGYALVGLSYRNSLPEWVVKGAQDIIDYSESK